MIDKDTADILAQGIYVSDLTKMNVEELDSLAYFAYADDPDVEVGVDSGGPEAGPSGHGVNAANELEHTLEEK